MVDGRGAFPELKPGWVWLVGAGPGDPGLLTLLAYDALQQAEVVVYDALVDDAVLDFVPDHVTLEQAGKRGGRPSPKQRDISQRLVQLARAGSRVVRLKGGDPLVFGRGGEEALALVDNGVPFRVVPGMTAGLGGLAYAGIPLTHRDTNSAVTFVTGHDIGGALHTSLDWDALCRAPVLVVYMGMKHLEPMAERLRAGGRPPDEPVAVVSRATTPGQHVLETTLVDAAADVAASGIQPPAVIVVGEVVRLRAGLDWLNALHGRTLVPDPLGERTPRDTG